MRILTAGESHGQANISILEGFPKGVKITAEIINQELKRRASGPGRGKRMSIESDKVQILSGLRNKITLGSPISLLVKNKDNTIFSQKPDALAAINVPRPAHADLAGALKYSESDVRNILERSSARETVARVCVGSVCKQFLSNLKIQVASFTFSLGDIISDKRPANIKEIINKTGKSKLNSIDKENQMLAEIDKTKKNKDTLGGIIEIWITGLPAGLGSCMHYDRRLDAMLAYNLMSIPAVKGVEVGLGFEYALMRGSEAHDVISHSKNKGFYRKTNNSGGIEGGISTGEPIVLRIAMKPISTLAKPLDSVNLKTKKTDKAPLVRSDTCAVVACGVIAEAMSAIVITEAILDKFGSDSLGEIKNNYDNYIKSKF
ncbi:MAG: chorismate synthase [Candidatus Omnitrophica bacterium]|nr:chorismate synthase [Candidatus Omnitrophota bacterium]MDD5430020.1 chorismate synthase [Candidatus Omnitrophota bacterium]